MIPSKSIALFQKLDTTITDVNRFVDAYMMRTIKSNHNYLVAIGLRNDVFSCPTVIDVFGTSALNVNPDEILFSTMLPIRHPTRQILMSIHGEGAVAQQAAIKVYPFCVPWGKPPRIELNRYISLPAGSATCQDITVDLRELAHVDPSRGWGLWHCGLACEDTITATEVYAATAITTVCDQHFACAVNRSNASGNIVVITSDADNPSYFCSRASVSGGITTIYTAQKFGKTLKSSGQTFTTLQLLHGLIYGLTIREVVRPSFNVAADGI